MKNNLKRRVLRGFYCTALASLALAISSTVAQAGVLDIGFTGLDFDYDGFVGFDISTSGADALNSVNFEVDGIAAGAAIAGSVSAELHIPGVGGIPVGGGTVTSGSGGTLDLVLGAGSLSLSLGEVTLNYNKIGSGIPFLFGGAEATVISQDLPYDLLLDDPIVFSFVTPIEDSSITDDSFVLTSFSASGGGSVSGGGSSGVVTTPEPASVVLAIMAMFGVASSSWVSKEKL